MQGSSRAPAGLSFDDVVGAAFVVLENDGITKLSTRAIARELGVRMNTVMWHIQTKGRLLDAMAESVIAEVAVDDLEGDWAEQAGELFHRLRQAMLGHRDGGLLVAGTFSARPRTVEFADKLVSLLLEGSLTRRSAAWTVWSLFYFTLGIVQEEQAVPERMAEQVRNSVDDERFPALASVLDDYLSEDYDDRFRYGITQILHSAATVSAPE